MNVFKFEFKRYFSSIWVWAVGIVGFLFLFMVFFPTFSDNSELMDQLLANYPENLLKAFGMMNEIPVSTVAGYVALLFPYIQICFAIQAAMLGFGMLSNEESNLTADFLLSKPLSRGKIFVGKTVAVALSLTITILLFWVGFYFGLKLFSDGKAYDFGDLQILMVTLFLFQWFVFAVSVLISQLVGKVKSKLSFAMGLALGFYILSAFEGMLGSEIFQFLTPYYYFNPVYLIQQQAMEAPFYWIAIVVSVVSFGASYWIYEHKDIQAI